MEEYLDTVCNRKVAMKAGTYYQQTNPKASNIVLGDQEEKWDTTRGEHFKDSGTAQDETRKSIVRGALHDKGIMHHGGADGQFPRCALDDARAARPSDALDARRQLSDPGAQPPRGVESSSGQLPRPELCRLGSAGGGRPQRERRSTKIGRSLR